MEQQITESLGLELRGCFNSHTASTMWKVWLYDNSTGMSLQVCDGYYTSKHKAEQAFAEALGFLRHSLQLNGD